MGNAPESKSLCTETLAGGLRRGGSFQGEDNWRGSHLCHGDVHQLVQEALKGSSGLRGL